MTHKHRRTGFTLMELLVVIGILAFLLTLLLPVMNKVRQSGYKTNTAAQINALRAGAEAYHQTFQAYPGPLSDQVCYGAAAPPTNTGGVPTMAENLVLGLLGGLSNNAGTITYVSSQVGKGPVSFGNVPKQFSPFYESSTQLSAGQFKDERGLAVMDPSVNGPDSNIPEFVDRFPEPLPVLYLRARRGAPGVVGVNEVTQYELRQMSRYTEDVFPATNPPSGLGGKRHGLRAPLGSDMTELKGGGPFEAQRYLQNPSEYGSNKTRLTSTPRAKDQYILIGAGVDRTYGTSDDITSFGSILP